MIFNFPLHNVPLLGFFSQLQLQYHMNEMQKLSWWLFIFFFCNSNAEKKPTHIYNMYVSCLGIWNKIHWRSTHIFIFFLSVLQFPELWFFHDMNSSRHQGKTSYPLGLFHTNGSIHTACKLYELHVWISMSSCLTSIHAKRMLGPNLHRTHDVMCAQIGMFFLWSCLCAVWILPLTTTGPICFASCILSELGLNVGGGKYFSCMKNIPICIFRSASSVNQHEHPSLLHLRPCSHRTQRCSQMLHAKNETHYCPLECSHSIANNCKQHQMICKQICVQIYLCYTCPVWMGPYI